MSVGLTFFGYFLSFLLETAALVLGIWYIWRHPFRLKKHQEEYLLFIIALCYITNLMEKTVVDGAESRWFYLIHPLGNLSPFLFTLALFTVFLPERDKQAFRAVCGIMCLSMIFAGYYNTVTRVLKFEQWLYTCIVFDNFGHLLFGLYGFYILRNRIVVFGKREKRFACAFVLLTALTMLVLNAIFKTSFFGLNLYGGHNIYNVVLTDSSALSALLYFGGLSTLLTLGCHFAGVIQTKAEKFDQTLLLKKEDAKGEKEYARL